MIYYLHSVCFHEKKSRQLSSSVKFFLHQFTHLACCSVYFNRVAAAEWSINSDPWGLGPPLSHTDGASAESDLCCAAWHREQPQKHRNPWQNLLGHPLWCPRPLWGWHEMWGLPVTHRVDSSLTTCTQQTEGGGKDLTLYEGCRTSGNGPYSRGLHQQLRYLYSLCETKGKVKFQLSNLWPSTSAISDYREQYITSHFLNLPLRALGWTGHLT